MPQPVPPLPKRYLWAQGTPAAFPTAGTVWAGRYQVVDFPLLLDLASEPPIPLPEVPPAAAPYLALSTFHLAIPRPFTQIILPDGNTLLLLENVPLRETDGEAGRTDLFPTLSAAWQGATAQHQLTWLWQVATLWQPCVDQGVARSLLVAENVRVDGEEVRLLSLSQDLTPPSLADLGECWRSLLPSAHPALQAYLTVLCDRLVAGEGSSAGLVQSLMAALEHQSAQSAVAVEFVTYSDQGPTRQRNEDACYPPGGTPAQALVQVETLPQHPAPMVIVCDGIGGHQGGDVASQLAIAETTRQLYPLTQTPNLTHPQICAALEQTVLAVNELLTRQNDTAQRHDRDRMGTTLVLALVYGTRLYVAHLGDSRAYRVRSHSCRQMTLDDDVAAREMRLGLGLYQDALQLPGAGSLVQALGMGESQYLYPTVTLHAIAEPSLVLLCTDGLSDNELVERLWPTELRPVLTGDRDIAQAGQRLITLANAYNGHDNVTVGLLRLVPQVPTSIVPIPSQLAQDLQATTAPRRPLIDTTLATPVSSPLTSGAQPRYLPLLATVGIVATLVGVAGAVLWSGWRSRSLTPPPPADAPGTILAPNAPPLGARVPSSLGEAPIVGDRLRIIAGEFPAQVFVTDGPPPKDQPPAVDLPQRSLPVGSIVLVQGRQTTADNERWVRLTVCTVPDAATSSGVSASPGGLGEGSVSPQRFPISRPGDNGWLREADLLRLAERFSSSVGGAPDPCFN